MPVFLQKSEEDFGHSGGVLCGNRVCESAWKNQPTSECSSEDTLPAWRGRVVLL